MDYTKYKNYKPFSAMTLKDNVPEYIVVHHSASNVDNFDLIQKYHITDPSHLWENVGYHAIIERDGTLKMGRPEHYHGAHVAEKGMNKKSIGVCLCGNFDTKLPSQAQIDRLRTYLLDRMQTYKIPVANILPHRTYAPYKSCYGTLLQNDWAQKLVTSNEVETLKDKLIRIKKIIEE